MVVAKRQPYDSGPFLDWARSFRRARREHRSTRIAKNAKSFSDFAVDKSAAPQHIGCDKRSRIRVIIASSSLSDSAHGSASFSAAAAVVVRLRTERE
jgi:hypothetical protein